ncbi:MAG: hypothetical protein CMB67_04395 [Euryarchaeota archaeon]|nr:hypothetical protein [Euryarchaeota archaeon]
MFDFRFINQVEIYTGASTHFFEKRTTMKDAEELALRTFGIVTNILRITHRVTPSVYAMLESPFRCIARLEYINGCYSNILAKAVVFNLAKSDQERFCVYAEDSKIWCRYTIKFNRTNGIVFDVSPQITVGYTTDCPSSPETVRTCLSYTLDSIVEEEEEEIPHAIDSIVEEDLFPQGDFVLFGTVY